MNNEQLKKLSLGELRSRLNDYFNDYYNRSWYDAPTLEFTTPLYESEGPVKTRLLLESVQPLQQRDEPYRVRGVLLKDLVVQHLYEHPVNYEEEDGLPEADPEELAQQLTEDWLSDELGLEGGRLSESEAGPEGTWQVRVSFDPPLVFAFDEKGEATLSTTEWAAEVVREAEEEEEG